MNQYHVNTFKEAYGLIKELGILPLANLIPDYPSMESITDKSSWHTGSEADPWLWRARFPSEGLAAYGKFIKKKNVLISKEFLPYVHAVLGSNRSIKARYEAGLLSREASLLFNTIRENEGIDTRLLRKTAGMSDKEDKKKFDRGLVELQSSLDIVISGTKMKMNEEGEKNGWSSTSFESMSHWAQNQDIPLKKVDKEKAKKFLLNHFEAHSTENGMKFLDKIFGLSKIESNSL
ncbi:AlkZ-related protein [Falsibacillus albus]|uniref:Uncharacterized protein n=1 Tax=Falsibacillus albus TaxID=2478915 RepID=A0A3L7JZU3_9BACI|nr:hypothetical protein [Falsibacillus albus]RLQ96307.1 hypothetical protein D9X91_08465 [Falsibacillus albus]